MPSDIELEELATELNKCNPELIQEGMSVLDRFFELGDDLFPPNLYEENPESCIGAVMLTVFMATSSFSVTSKALREKYMARDEFPDGKKVAAAYLNALGEILGKTAIISTLNREIKQLQMDNSQLRELLELASENVLKH